MLKTFTDHDLRDSGQVVALTDCPVADTFGAFAEQFGVDGFAFLHQRLTAGLDDGPVLVAVRTCG